MNFNLNKIGAVVITTFLLGALFLAPVSSAPMKQQNRTISEVMELSKKHISQDFDELYEDPGPFWLDRTYILEDLLPATLNGDNDDAGYKQDAGDEISRSNAIYPGEMVDDWPGRGQTGKLSATDDEDWYFFSVCEGQDIQITMTPPSGFNFDLGLWDDDENERDTSTNSGSTPESITFTADYTAKWYMRIHYISGTGEGQYSFDVTLSGQNDANTGNDAGDDFATATSISQGSYDGYLDMNDEEDWYKFTANSGQGIHFNLDMKSVAYLSDFDIYLYNPSGGLVHYESYYYDDELLYPADENGEWRVKIDIFPGYTDIPQPTEWEYFTYGSGAYEFEFALEGSAPSPPGPIPQPAITTIAQTFKITNDPDSNADEYGYLASIPACNYLESGNRYLAPIIYMGDDTLTNWFGTVDDTTDYLLEDWDEYLLAEGKIAEEYNVANDPVEAAADIATTFWTSSDLAVVAVDGSNYEDTITEVLHKTKTLPRNAEVITVPNDSPDIIEIGGAYAYLLEGPFGGPFIGKKWGAINVSIEGVGTTLPEPSLTQIFPKFMHLVSDWWPEHTSQRYDIYYPITTNGIWAAGTSSISGDWEFKITKYECDRYNIKVDDDDATLKATVTTSTPSDLLVFLVDPQGHIRAPDIPDWNGGEINPIHVWNGIDNGDPSTPCGPFRGWNPEPHTEFTAEVLHPEKGTWTAIVVPRNAQGSSSIQYTISGEIKKLNPNRVDAAISAANAAVIASLEHVPLLFVDEDSIPAETASAFTSLGVDNVIFVESGGIGSSVSGDLPSLEADLITIQEIIDYIKDYSASENYITITSLKSGDGYFAPSAMLAAYHGSPVLRLEDADSVVTSVPVNYNFVVGQINENVYVMDTSTGEILWSNPAGWTPENVAPTSCPEGTVYLGSTEDIVFFIGDSNGEVIWSDPVNYAGAENVGGNLFLNLEEGQVYLLGGDNGDEEPLPLFGSAEWPDPAGMANRIDTWRLWGGDYYHGNRAPGHLPIHDEPVEQLSDLQLIIDLLKYLSGSATELPPLGMDAKRYWNEKMYNGIYKWIDDYGLDLDGQEAYVFVAPRKDIRLEAHSIMMGNNSYAGHIPGETPAYTNDIIMRNVLYPALIYANPNRDVTTTQLMNYPDGGTWRTNDGVSHQVYSSRVLKNAFMSHGRTYDGHCLWDAHLERMNDGASVLYYSGHGTGGSGMSAQYIQTPYSNYPTQVWPDAWRGYMYDNWKTVRDNGMRWYNPEPPNLYDFIHYKWIDQLLENLKSNAVFYMSCSTAQQFGPTVYLDHGAVIWYGNAGSGLCPQADLQDDWFFEDAMIYGEPIGPAFANTIWLHYRDFTTSDPTAMYGPSSLYGTEGITTIQCIYGDPNLIVYSPDWTIPVAVESPIGRANNPPFTPDIAGETNGEAGVEYTYDFCSTDPDGDDIYYCIDWGDDSGEVCIGPYPSATCATAKHTWSEQGTYIIKAKARDIYDAESDWGTLAVTMPTNDQQHSAPLTSVAFLKSLSLPNKTIKNINQH
jgi:hypothetical protein